MIDLDAADRRILEILQVDNRLTNLELAERANLSAPTCLRRVRRLREDGVIAADVSLLDPFIIGSSLIVFVEVVMERQSEDLQREFERKMNGEDDVAQCYMVSGDIDFLVIAHVADMPAYHRFVRRVFASDPNVRNFRSLFAMDRTKFKTAIRLDGFAR
jgi:Lrp/AsnC family leucine-responsive transcriptional regulator